MRPDKRSARRPLPSVPHPLALWLRENGISPSRFAAEIGLHRTTLSKILNGRSLVRRKGKRARPADLDKLDRQHPPRFTLTHARKIVDVTHGAVSLEACLYHWADRWRG